MELFSIGYYIFYDCSIYKKRFQFPFIDIPKKQAQDFISMARNDDHRICNLSSGK